LSSNGRFVLLNYSSFQLSCHSILHVKLILLFKYFYRPGASAGVWMSFLLPTAVILSAYSCHNVSELYRTAATLSLGLLGTSVVLLAKTCSSKTHEYTLIIPSVFTYIRLYFYNKMGKFHGYTGCFKMTPRNFCRCIT
jgi:hypothetical protein